MDALSITVICGGRSSEHSISLLSARGVIPALRAAGHRVEGIAITRAGAWIHLDIDHLLRNEEPLPELPASAASVGISWSPQGAVFVAPDGSTWRPDVVFPILHGPWGEDGSVQGFLETLGLPFVGSGVLSSACAMDKPVMKTILRAAGLPVGDWSTAVPTPWPGALFVKPARAGSSIGISRVEHPADIEAAVTFARAHDTRVIFEIAFDRPREIECGLLELPSGELRASVCAEISVPGGFYDFDAKYRSDVATLTVPADIPAAIASQIQELSIAAFRALACEGYARADFFWLEDGSVMINEVNTIPGFTPISMYPRMWQASGVSFEGLVDILVRSALA